MTLPGTAPELLPAEELPVGEDVDCGTHAVTEEEIVAFATQWDPQYFHVSPELAAHSDFGGIIASGLHTVSIYQRLAVGGLLRRFDVVAGREITSLRFLRPVRPGDVLGCTVRVRTVEPAGPGRSRALIAGVLHNQHGKPVLELEVDSLLRSRSI
ncbi:MAG: dehydratase [Acidobacteria bacterium]|nr:MAG: dehydratase [Acidobacteriota bacterium]